MCLSVYTLYIYCVCNMYVYIYMNPDKLLRPHCDVTGNKASRGNYPLLSQ